MRREVIGDATLYLGDAREIVPGLRFDVLLTDPVWPNAPAGSIAGSDDPAALWQAFQAVCPPMKRQVVVMRADSDPRFLGAVPPSYPFFRAMWLPYVVPGYIGRKLGGDEIAYWFGACIASASNRRVVPGRAPMAQSGHRAASGHPMSRPQIHIDWLAYWSSDSGETVLDPFMGSGTTGIACVKLGRPFLGVEIEPRFFDLACRRIEAAHRGTPDLLRIAESAA